MKDALIVSLLSVIPQHLGSRLQGAFARAPLSGAVHHAIIRAYCRKYDVDMDAFVGSVEDYPTLAQFFVRPLRVGLRPIDPSQDALVSPADARAATFGTLEGHKLPADAGMELDIQAMLGGDPRYENGEYAVLYLSPRDYHRVHHPREGRVLGYRYLPGRLWPVFPAATRKVKDLFAVNERLLVRLDAGPAGEVAVVLVGAYGVGRMTCSFCDLVTNTGGGAETRDFPAPIPVARGEELGRFNLGSTVVLVTEPGRVEWELTKGEMVQVGQRIARVV
jgi:phosphatidylserine decarboxylase